MILGLNPLKALQNQMLTGVNLPWWANNMMQGDMMKQPITFETALQNLASQALQHISRNDEDAKIIQMLQAMNFDIDDSIMAMPPQLRSQFLRNTLEAALKANQQKILERAETETLLEREKQLLPLQVQELASVAALKQSIANPNLVSPEAFSEQDIEAFAQFLNLTPEVVRQLLQDPKARQNLLSNYSMFVKNQKLQEQQGEQRLQLKQFDRTAKQLEGVREDLKTTKIIQGIQNPEALHKVMRDALYSSGNVSAKARPEQIIDSLELNFEGKRRKLGDVFSEIEKKLAESQETGELNLTADERALIGARGLISALADRNAPADLSQVIENLDQYANKLQISPMHLARGIGQIYAAAIGPLEPKKVVERIRGLLGAEDQSDIASLASQLENVSFDNTTALFQAMKGAISDREFQTLMKISSGGTMNTPALISALIYFMYRTAKKRQQLESQAQQLESKLNTLGTKQ